MCCVLPGGRQLDRRAGRRDLPGEREQGGAGVQVLQSQGASELVQEQAGGIPGPQVQTEQRRRRLAVVHQ